MCIHIIGDPWCSWGIPFPHHCLLQLLATPQHRHYQACSRFFTPPSVMAPTFCPLASEIPQGNSSMKIGHMAEICLHLSAIAKCNPCVQYKCKYLMLELKGLPLVLLVGLQRHLSYFLLETHELDGLKEWTLKPLFSWFQEDEKL